MPDNTQNEIQKINKLCADRGITLALMQKDISNINKTVAKIDGKLDKMNKQFAGKWVEKAFVAVVIIFALASLYLLFDKAGLPR